MKKNILVVALSTLKNDNRITEYNYYEAKDENDDNPKIAYQCFGRYQLSPIPYFLKDYLKIELTDVILICTKETKIANKQKKVWLEQSLPCLEKRISEKNAAKETPLQTQIIGKLYDLLTKQNSVSECEYYKKFLELLFKKVNITCIETFDHSSSDSLAEILEKILGELKKEYKDFIEEKNSTDEWHLYFDNHGGFREIPMTLGAASQMLSFNRKPIKTNAIFTVLYGNDKPSIIKNQIGFYAADTYDMLGQFMNYGQDILMEFSPYEYLSDKSSEKQPYCYISYRHDNRYINYVKIFFRTLTDLNKKFWFDSEQHNSEEWDRHLSDELENSSTFIVLMTKSYFESYDCWKELIRAFKKKKNIQIVRIDNYTPSGNLDEDINSLDNDFSKDKLKRIINEEKITINEFKSFYSKLFNPQIQFFPLDKYMDMKNDVTLKNPERLKKDLKRDIFGE